MSQVDKAFEIFVQRAVGQILKESTGRSKEAKELSLSCQAFLTALEAHGSGGTISQDGGLALAVLQPLQLACGSHNIKVVELALGALHKLVAHAWLQGESSASEELIADDSDTVARVIKLVIKCGEISNAGLQLSVIRALLTFTTAEHFVPHGDSLMSAVRTVFNLALGSEDENIKRTACNALLQMLNTVAKRVTAYSCHSFSTTPSRRESEQGGGSVHGEGHFGRASITTLSPTPSLNYTPSQHHGSYGGEAGTAPLPHSTSALSDSSAAVDAALAADQQELGADARTAQFASLAEQRDIRGLEAAIGANLPDQAGSQPSARPSGSSAGGPSNNGGLAPEGSTPHGLGSVGQVSGSGSASLPGVNAGRDASITLSAGGALPAGNASAGRGAVTAAPPSIVHLTVVERDVLLVLTAFCKLASREAGLTEVESYLHQGKLLALELLVKVLQNPQHKWDNVREDLTRHLRQPLCITLLRNCAATDPAAFQLAIKLLLAIIMQPRLRRGLKAELGAFYPLFVLRPLELGAGLAGGASSQAPGSPNGSPVPQVPGEQQTDLNTLFVVLTSLKQLCTEQQLLADLFVNYDCDLHAPALFERTLTAVGRLAQKTDASDLADRPSSSSAQLVAKQQQEIAAKLATIRDVALKCVTSLVIALDAWAAPLKDAAQAAAASIHGDGGSNTGGSLGADGSSVQDGSSEAERLEAAWAHKSSLSKGVALFNARPVKGIQQLIAQSIIEGSPAAVASFIRAHTSELDKSAVGELFGHHGEFEISIMHAFIDQERYAGVALDAALRTLLAQFRLPGEAQKIDRIMEKFAERYVCDNPGAFYNADGAYLLSFAIIMLNTDAHNPLAERRLAKGDFVAMCHQPLSEEDGGGMEPVLPPVYLEGIYDRIVANEIQVHDPEAVAARAQSAAAHAASRNSAGARARLAAALGLNMLAAPFKPLARSWGKVAEGLGEAERKRSIIQLAERAIGRGSGGLWATALHAELARPMLTLGAAAILGALSFGLHAAPNAAAAEPLIQCLVQLVQLAAALRLDEVVERGVDVMAGACGVHNPAPYASPQEAKQLAVLQALLSLPGMPCAAALGGAWTTLLRAMSALDALTTELTEPASGPPVASSTGGMSSFSTATSAAANPFNKMFAALGINLGTVGSVTPTNSGTSGIAGAPLIMLTSSSASNSTHGGAAGAQDGGATAVPLRAGPGASLVLWAATEGRVALASVVERSTQLDGDAVVVLFRAMCAVSREELEQPRPRMYFLTRVVEAAHANTGRIRLVWGKLWAVASAHLVAASCHTSQSVALYAAGVLRALVMRLLGRSELAHFRAQEEALRPFVAVLRQCDDPTVRAAVVMHASEAAASHPRGLGMGWRTFLEVMWRAAADPSPEVASRAIEGMGVAVDALYRGTPSAGHEYLRELVRAAMVAVRNQAAGEAVSLAGVSVLVGCGSRLAEHVSTHGHPALAATASAHRVPSLMAPSPTSTSDAPPPTELSFAQGLAVQGSMPISPNASLGGAGATASARHSVGDASGAGGGGDVSVHSVSSDRHVGLPSLPSFDMGSTSVEDAWGLLLSALSDIAQSDARSRVSAAAVQAIFDVMATHSAQWSDAAWQVLLHCVLASLFRVPASSSARRLEPTQESVYGQDEVGPPPSPEFIARIQHYFPLMCDQLSKVTHAYHEEMLVQLAATCLMWLEQPHQALASAGLQGYETLVSQVAGKSDHASLQRLLDLLAPVLQSSLESVMGQTHQLQQGWLEQQPVHLASSSLPPALCCRSRTLTMSHRLLARLHQQHAAGLPWPLQLQLLQPLLGAAHAAMSFNLMLEQEVLEVVASRPAVLHLHQASPLPHSPLPRQLTGAAATQPQPQQPDVAHTGTGASPFAASLHIANVASEGGASPVLQQLQATEAAPAGAHSMTDERLADGILAASGSSLERASGNEQPVTPPQQQPAAVTPSSHQEEAGIWKAGAAGTVTPSPSARQPPVAGRGPGVLLYSADSHVLQHLGLARLEMEAVTTALDLLESTLESAEVSRRHEDEAGSGTESAPCGALHMLNDLCYFVIAQCSDALARAADVRASFVAQGLQASSQQATPLFSGTWLDSMRAPVLARVILTYMQLPSSREAADVQRLFPHMLVLMCSHQERVREAVAAYIGTTIEPLLQLAAKSVPAQQSVFKRP